MIYGRRDQQWSIYIPLEYIYGHFVYGYGMIEK